nr:immunoglobulin heavy chain junction region [Mus musculus]
TTVLDRSTIIKDTMLWT